jgi:GNAT superfamily N-acetyltransferase
MSAITAKAAARQNKQRQPGARFAAASPTSTMEGSRMRTPVRLNALHFHELVTHFLALPPQDRRLRFGHAMADEAVIDYVGSIDFERDAVYGVVDPVLDIAGALHLARGDHAMEIGLSVLPQARGSGIGSRLLEHAAEVARERGVPRLYVRGLTHNEAMQRLARRAGMPIVTAANGTDGALQQALAAQWAALGPRSPVVLVDSALRAEPRPAARPAVAHSVRRYELHP